MHAVVVAKNGGEAKSLKPRQGAISTVGSQSGVLERAELELTVTLSPEPVSRHGFEGFTTLVDTEKVCFARGPARISARTRPSPHLARTDTRQDRIRLRVPAPSGEISTRRLRDTDIAQTSVRRCPKRRRTKAVPPYPRGQTPPSPASIATVQLSETRSTG